MNKTVYSVKLQQALSELRPAFSEIGQGLDQLTRKRAEIAPLFTRAYQIWRRETRRPFIAFVQELDPTMPVNDRKAYRQHRSYRAAQYLLQLVEQADKTAPRGLRPMAMLAVVIKSLLPLYKTQKDQKEALQVLMSATRWRERDVAKLLRQIRRARPIALPHAPRLVEANKATKAVVVAFERERVA